MQRRAEAVLFDFGGTLDSNGIPWLDRFYPLYLEHGADIEREAFTRAFYAADDDLPHRFPLSRAGLEETVSLQVQSVFEALAPESPDMDKVAAISRAFVKDSRAHFRRITPLLARLSNRYALGIVSNFYGNLQRIIEEEGLARFFKVVADSEEVGHMKPAPEIFRHALDRLRVEPSRAWMVGDSLNRDMRGAEGLGMAHAWLKEAGDGAACCQEGVVLASLEDIPVVLGDSENLQAVAS